MAQMDPCPEDPAEDDFRVLHKSQLATSHNAKVCLDLLATLAHEYPGETRFAIIQENIVDMELTGTESQEYALARFVRPQLSAETIGDLEEKDWQEINALIQHQNDDTGDADDSECPPPPQPPKGSGKGNGSGKGKTTPASEAKVWSMPKFFTNRTDQVEEIEEKAEEHREMVIAAQRKVLARRGHLRRGNLFMALCPCLLEQRRQYLLRLCTRELPGRAIVVEIGSMVDDLIFLLDKNQDITDQISEIKAASGSRLRRGLPLGAALKSLSESLDPPAQLNDIYQSGRKAFTQAVKTRLINPSADTTETSKDRQMWYYLHPNEETKSFIHFSWHVQSAYVACLQVPIQEVIDLVPKKYQAAVEELYKMLCDDPLEKSGGSLTFVLKVSKYLDSFPDDGSNSEEEVFAANTFFFVKEAIVCHPTVWTDHVSLHSNGEADDDDEADDGDDFFDNTANRRAAMNAVTYLACGKQIGKAAREHDEKYQEIEDFRSVVLRCSMNNLTENAKSMVKSQFLQKGTAATASNDGSNKFDALYSFSAARIDVFESDVLIAFDMNDNKEDAAKKEKLAFDNMAFTSSEYGEESE